MQPSLGLTRSKSDERVTDTSPTTSIQDKDAAAAFLADVSPQSDAAEDIDPAAERRLLWKIDLLYVHGEAGALVLLGLTY